VVTNADLVDAGRLLGWAARPKDRPARHHDYQRLVQRYREEEQFACVCEQVALGAGLRLVVDDEVGVIAIASSDSPLRITRTEFVRRTTPTARRALPGLVLLADQRRARRS
jgi:hypothetical protein